MTPANQWFSVFAAEFEKIMFWPLIVYVVIFIILLGFCFNGMDNDKTYWRDFTKVLLAISIAIFSIYALLASVPEIDYTIKKVEVKVPSSGIYNDVYHECIATALYSVSNSHEVCHISALQAINPNLKVITKTKIIPTAVEKKIGYQDLMENCMKLWKIKYKAKDNNQRLLLCHDMAMEAIGKD